MPQLTPRDAFWKVLADIQAQSQNAPQPDFSVKAEVPSAQQILEAGAANDPFRLDKIVKLDMPTQPKVDWAALEMIARRNASQIQQQMATIGPVGGVPQADRPNPLAGMPIAIQGDGPALPGIEREPISLGWRQPEAIARRAMVGAGQQFDAPTPVRNALVRMGAPLVAGGAGMVAGGPLGMAVGGAMGAAVGEDWAQQRETAQGTRAGVNPLAIPVAGFAQMLPMANAKAGVALAPQLPRIAGSAMAGNAAGDAALQFAETGTLDLSQVALAAGLGGVLGTGATVGARALGEAASSPAAAALLSDETGAVGPNIRQPLGQPDAPAGGEAARFKKLPASARGVIDPLTPVRGETVSPGQKPVVPDSMTPSGFTPAELRADRIRVGKAVRRHNVTDAEEAEFADVYAKGKAFAEHRRMHTSWAQRDMEASIVVPDVRLPKGTALNDTDLTALRRDVHGLAARTVEITNDLRTATGLDAKAAAGDMDAKAQLDTILNTHGVSSLSALKLARHEAKLESDVGIKSLMGVKSEAGRALNSLRSFQKKREMGDADFLIKAIEAGDDGDKAMDALASLRNSDGTPNRLAQFKYISSLAKPGAQQYWHWYARTAYLSSVATQWRNFAGNAANFGIESLLVRPAAAALDSFNADRTVTASELRAMGTTSGFLDGLDKARFFFKNGFTQDDVDAFENLPPEVFGGALFPNAVGRGMGAVDQFFRTIGFHVELHRMAIAEAHGKGLRGDAMLQHAKALIDDPTITPDLVKRAERYAAGLTFQDSQSSPWVREGIGAANAAMKWVDKGTRHMADWAWDRKLSQLDGKYSKVGSAVYGLMSFPPSVIIAPFINTPFNILKRAAQFTPAGLLAAKAGDRDRMMIAGRGAVGTAMMGAAAGLWMQGRITGRAPAYGTPEAELSYAESKPYSVKIGGQWIPYSYLGPVGMVLGATVNYLEAASKDPKNAVNLFGQLFAQVGRTAVDATFLRGMQSVLTAIADDSSDQRAAQRVFNRTATGLLPAAGALRDVRNLVDPVLRDPVTSTDMKGAEPTGMLDQMSVSLAPIKEQIMGAVPGLSQKLEPRLNSTGEEIRRPTTVFGEAKEPDPVRRELFRLYQDGKEGYYRDPVGAGKSLLGKINTEIRKKNKADQGDRPLLAQVPRPLVTAYAKRYGQESERRLTQILQMPRFKAMSDDEKRRQIEIAKRKITELVDREFAKRYLTEGTRR